MMESGAITNVITFAEEIIIDLEIGTTAMHIRKRAESDIQQCITETFGSHIKTTVNCRTRETKENQGTTNTTKAPTIKGKPIAGIQNIVAIASGKGGVGKSTVTANIAVSLAKMGFKVGILDADIYGPSIPIMFDVEQARPRSVQVGNQSKMEPIQSHGVAILSIGFFTRADQAVVWRGPMAAKALNQMIFDAAWGKLDFLLVDLPPGTGDIHLSIMQSLPITGAVVVSTPQHIALADARKGVAMFQQDSIAVPVLGMVENMAFFTPAELPGNKYYIFGQGGAEALSERLEIPFLGSLPLVQSIREAADAGRPAALQSDTISEVAFEQLTQKIVEQVVYRNTHLEPTEAIKITTMAGCAAIKPASSPNT